MNTSNARRGAYALLACTAVVGSLATAPSAEARTIVNGVAPSSASMQFRAAIAHTFNPGPGVPATGATFDLEACFLQADQDYKCVKTARPVGGAETPARLAFPAADVYDDNGEYKETVAAFFNEKAKGSDKSAWILPFYEDATTHEMPNVGSGTGSYLNGRRGTPVYAATPEDLKLKVTGTPTADTPSLKLTITQRDAGIGCSMPEATTTVVGRDVDGHWRIKSGDPSIVRYQVTGLTDNYDVLGEDMFDTPTPNDKAATDGFILPACVSPQYPKVDVDPPQTPEPVTGSSAISRDGVKGWLPWLAAPFIALLAWLFTSAIPIPGLGAQR